MFGSSQRVFDEFHPPMVLVTTIWVSGLVLLAAGVCVVEVLGYILPQYQRTIESRSMDVSPSNIRRSYVSELDRLGFLTGSFEPLVGFGLSCVDFCESVD
ncbi:hypothetical protein CLU79DRAFT_838484 [Phycomyces nitens]|nr:hypothetical protein CLU79DRAFT_838484 [Phycomyces nitens]